MFINSDDFGALSVVLMPNLLYHHLVIKPFNSCDTDPAFQGRILVGVAPAADIEDVVFQRFRGAAPLFDAINPGVVVAPTLLAVIFVAIDEECNRVTLLRSTLDL